MKKSLLILSLFCVQSVCFAQDVARSGWTLSINRNENVDQHSLSVKAPNQSKFVPGVLTIQFKVNKGIDFDHLTPNHTGNSELDHFFASIGVTDIYPFDADAKNYAVARRHGIDRVFTINFPEEGNSPEEISEKLLLFDVIDKAFPRFIHRKCLVPNDPSLSQQYALDNMTVKSAWDVTKGNANIIIADLDEGVNYNHEDLAANIYKLNGKFGYNFVGTGTSSHFIPNFDPMPSATFNHGTMTSGCFGAVVNNGLGGAGSGYNCKIFAIKIADDQGNLVAGDQGIQYAVEHGAKIINCSWGVILDLKKPSEKSYFEFEQSLIDEAQDTGSLVVAAAGNDGYSLDDSTFSPASLKGLLCVGATDQADKAASFTNYGHPVHVYAPGVSIFSTSFPGNSTYDSENGTSFSCPLTAGVAGLLWALHPDWTPNFIARQLIQTCDNVVNPSNRIRFWGRVNASNAVKQATVPGLIITDFSIDGVDKGGLAYLNKEYTLLVTFKNVMYSGTGLQVRLLAVSNPSGLPSPSPGYSVQQGISNLGQMAAQQSTQGLFKFTRDSTDQGKGSQLELFFAVSYGSSTVEGNSYFDTLKLILDITGDNSYVAKAVRSYPAQPNTRIAIYPNPIRSTAMADYYLSAVENSKISLCDILGRTVSTISEGIFGQGEHELQFDTQNFDNGIYFIKLETPEGIKTSRILILH